MAEADAYRERLMQELQEAPDELLRPILDILRAYQNHRAQGTQLCDTEDKLLMNRIRIDTTQWSFRRDDIYASGLR